MTLVSGQNDPHAHAVLEANLFVHVLRLLNLLVSD